MHPKSGQTPPAAVFVDPSGRRRRAFRVGLVAVILGWLAVAALVAVGLISRPDVPKSVLAAPSTHRQAPGRTANGRPAASFPALRAAGAEASQGAQRTSATKLSETSTVREFTPLPAACTQQSKCADRGCRQSVHATTAVVFSSVQAAFNGVGVASAGDIPAGNFDCRGFSFQAQSLAADGFGPGDRVAADGQTLTLPAVAAGAPDEIAAEGQVIRLNPAHVTGISELGFLGAGEFGTQAGTVTISYTNGSRQRATLRLADWYADTPAAGSVTAAAALWNVPAAHSARYGPSPVSVYYTEIAVNPAKKIASVTLPKNANLHLFAVGRPAPARFPSVSAADNDTGLAPANSAANRGNFDGAGHSYDATALAGRGLRPGARITARGVTFTWPDYAAGRLDNVRAEGQTIAVAGAGRVLGFLGASTLGTQRGTVIIHYADGSSQSVVISFADWRAGRPAAGGTTLATVPETGAGAHRVSVYAATVPLEAGKIVTSVTLPVDFDLHVFAIAAGG